MTSWMVSSMSDDPEIRTAPDDSEIKSASEIIDEIREKDWGGEPINIYEYAAHALDELRLENSGALAEIQMPVDTTKFTDGDEVKSVGKIKIKEGDKVLFKASHDKRKTAFVARDDHHKTNEARN